MLFRIDHQAEEGDKFLSSFDDLINYISNEIPLFLDIPGDFYVNISLIGRNRNHIQKGNRSKLPGLHRILIDTTHLLEKLSSFINLILKNQFNLVVGHSIHPSPRPNYYQPLVHCKLNLSTKHPPPYEHSSCS